MGTFTLQPGPMLHTAQAVCRMLQLHLLFGPVWIMTSLESEFHLIIVQNVSPVCYASRLSCLFQTADDVQMTLNHPQPYVGTKQSTAHFHSWTAKCDQTVPCSVQAKPGNV